jgi:hypothetical protein
MLDRKPIYSPEEHARLGNQTYEREIRAKVEQNHQGQVVAIDVDSAEFEIADNSLAASQLLLARIPQAQIWCVRIGPLGVNRFGPRGSAMRV